MFNGYVFCIKDEKVIGVMRGMWHDADEDMDDEEKGSEDYEVNEPAAFEIEEDIFGTVSTLFGSSTLYEGWTEFGGVFDKSQVIPGKYACFKFLLDDDESHDYFVLD